MPKSAISTYGFINARLRARLGLLLTEEKYNQLISAPTLEEMLSYLRDTPYEILERVYRDTGDIKLAELELFKKEIAIFGDILKSVTDKAHEIVKSLMMKYEVENLKNLLRIFFSRTVKNQNVENLILYIYRERIVHDIDVDSIVNADSLATVLDALKKTPYQKTVEEEWPVVQEKGTVFFLEVKLDHLYYKNLLNMSGILNQRDRYIFNRLIGVEIDIQNIDLITRLFGVYGVKEKFLREILIPGGHRINISKMGSISSSEDISEILKGTLPGSMIDIKDFDFSDKRDIIRGLELIEAMLEEMMLKEAKKALAGYPFSIGVILGYYVIKTRELRKLRAIMNAKVYGISPDALKRSL